MIVADGGVRFRTTPCEHPGSGAQGIVDGLPDDALAPTTEVIVYTLLGQIVVWRQAPDLLAKQDVEDRIQHPS
jgi:hypothetical protein